MISQDGYQCHHCGELHDGPPLAYGLAAPVYWHDGLASNESSELVDEQCVIEGEHLFVRARLLIPVVDAGTDFEWGVWTSLSEASFVRMGEL